MQDGIALAVVVAWAVLTAPPVVHARQHQHGGTPPVAREPLASREESPLNLKNVLKAADRSVAVLEKAARAERDRGPEGASAVRDYVNLVGWVARRFEAAAEDGIVDPREVERVRKSLSAHAKRLASLSAAAPDTEAAAQIAQAREAATVAAAAVEAASATALPRDGHQEHRGHESGCGHH